MLLKMLLRILSTSFVGAVFASFSATAKVGSFEFQFGKFHLVNAWLAHYHHLRLITATPPL